MEVGVSAEKTTESVVDLMRRFEFSGMTFVVDPNVEPGAIEFRNIHTGALMGKVVNVGPTPPVQESTTSAVPLVQGRLQEP
jgi:hypothetical protein